MKKSVFALLIPILVVASLGSAEEPEYTRWKLEYEYSTPDYVAMKDALGKQHVCWFITYKVTNKSDKDIPLGIQISAETEDKLKYLDSISPLAQKALEKKTGKKYKNALEMRKGTIGAKQSIEAVAFLGSLDPNFDFLYVTVDGLVDRISKEDGEMWYEQKVLVVTFYRPGDEFDSANDEITWKSDEWKVLDRKKIEQTPKE